MSKTLARLLLATAFLTLLGSCATNVDGRKQLMLVSESTAINASKEAYVETLDPLEKEGKINSNANLVQRIQAITDKLIVQAKIKRPDTQDWEWQVKVIDDPETVNAWCMAGGKMAIYTGLIDQLNATDDEIAQVMGHEISHALANHSAERMSVAIATNAALGVLAVTTDSGGTTLSLAAMAAQVALTLPNSRASESEADRIGIELAARAGYNPHAAVSLWQKMGALGSSGPEFLSTHPSPDNRQQALEALIPQMMPLYQQARGS